MKSLHIFKSGTHTDMSGAMIRFSEADLAATAAAYDPNKHEAPIVVGHPRHDAPAYGWVRSLKSSAGGLEVAPQQLDASFAELVSAGRYKKISASFYSPGSPSNPVPGVYYLRHVGFLGAMPPAVKGLRSTEFAEAEEGVIEFAETADVAHAPGGILERLRAWLVAQFGQQTVDQLLDPAAHPLPAPPTPKETPVTPEQEAALTEENKSLQSALETLKKQLADLMAKEKEEKTEKIDEASTDFAEDLIKKGRLAPKHKETVVALLNAVAADQKLEFGEGRSKRPLDGAVRDWLKELPEVVEFGETATKGRAAGPGEKNPLLADAEARSAK